jgi:DNA repair protein RadC
MTTTELIADIEARLDVGNILPVHIRKLCQECRDLELALRLAKHVEVKMQRKFDADMKELREMAGLGVEQPVQEQAGSTPPFP